MRSGSTKQSLPRLRAAIDEGEASGIAEGNAFGRFRKPRASRVAIAMGRFRPSRRAEVGLLSEYTLHKWGKAQAARYIGELEVCCQTLAYNQVLGRLCDHVRPACTVMSLARRLCFTARRAVAVWFLASCINASARQTRHRRWRQREVKKQTCLPDLCSIVPFLACRSRTSKTGQG